MSAKLNDLPQDREALESLVRSLILEREQQSKRAHDLQGETLRQRKRADELHLENLRLQLELQRYKKWYYGPRADRLATSADLALLARVRKRGFLITRRFGGESFLKAEWLARSMS